MCVKEFVGCFLGKGKEYKLECEQVKHECSYESMKCCFDNNIRIYKTQQNELVGLEKGIGMKCMTDPSISS